MAPCLLIMRVLSRHYYVLLRGIFLFPLLGSFSGTYFSSFSAGNESNYRTAAYEAITSYLTQATPDAIGVVQSTIVTILQRMEHLLSIQNQIVGVDDRNNWNELQSNLCSVVIVSFD